VENNLKIKNEMKEEKKRKKKKKNM